MTSRWDQRALELFERAIALPENEVASFLDSACADEGLRADVESFLASSKRADGFISSSREKGSPTRSAPAEVHLQEGLVLMDRYAVKEVLGSGGMGDVYRANDTRLGRDVAIKVLNDAHASDPIMRERFDREMRSVAALSHPNVMAIHDIGDHDGIRFAVMELVEGKVLRRLMDEVAPIQQTLGIVSGVAAGLAGPTLLVSRETWP